MTLSVVSNRVSLIFVIFEKSYKKIKQIGLNKLIKFETNQSKIEPCTTPDIKKKLKTSD